MRAKILVLFGVFLVLCIDTAMAETLLSGPATLSQAGEYYRLTRDITASGTAFTITANDVTLDLDGHTVTYNTGSGTSYGVRITGSNSEVKNGIIIQGNGKSAYSHGVYASGSGSELHYLIIKVTGDRCYGIRSTADNVVIHHIFII